LTDKDREEARRAGQKVRDIHFDQAYTSVLQRATETLDIMLKVISQEGVQVAYDRALNERHYGDLHALNKAETAEKFGKEQVHLWRRSYDVAPPEAKA
jgi:2,3-bisphosphoglycerate-dependent phosphoglycerate mutase